MNRLPYTGERVRVDWGNGPQPGWEISAVTPPDSWTIPEPLKTAVVWVRRTATDGFQFCVTVDQLSDG